MSDADQQLQQQFHKNELTKNLHKILITMRDIARTPSPSFISGEHRKLNYLNFTRTTPNLSIKNHTHAHIIHTHKYKSAMMSLYKEASVWCKIYK